MKPMIVLPLGAVSKEDMQGLRDNDICVVEAQDPATVRFMDPIAAAGDRSQIDAAAIELSRVLLNGIWKNFCDSGVLNAADIRSIFAKILIEGTPLARTTKAHVEQEIFDAAKADELRRLAREEAKADRAAARAAKAAKTKTG